MHPFEGVVWLTTVATIVLLLAGDDDLGGDVDIGPRGLTGNLNPVRDGGGGSMGPAGTAVLGDVLVADVGNVANTVNVVPFPGGGKVVDMLEGSDNDGLSSMDAALVAWGVKGDSAGLISEDSHAQKSDDGERFHVKEISFFNYY